MTVGMAGGAMIANEPFEGPDANDVNASTGGTGWAGGWVDSNAAVTQFVFSAPGLALEGFNNAGFKALLIRL